MGKSLEDNLQDVPKRVRIEPMEDVTSFVDSIMVHPLAADWYVGIVPEICHRTQLPFDGKSKLYA